MKRTLLLVLVCACQRNIAADNVRYVETGAQCEDVITESDYQSARCTLPSGQKLYCSIDKKAAKLADAWSCIQLAGAKTAATPTPTPAFTPPVPPPVPPGRPAPYEPPK